MKPSYVVDADGHVAETAEGMRRFVPEPWNKRPIFSSTIDTFDRGYFGTLGKQPRPSDAHTHLQDMDLEGIDLAVLYPSHGLSLGYISDPDWQTVYCRAYNDWLADFCSADPNRMKGVALVPLHDIKRACEELNRAQSLGLVGVMVPTYFEYGPPNVGHQYFDPFYAEAERLGVPVAIHAHGGMTVGRHRFGTFLQVHLLSHVPEQMAAMVATVIGGVFERFPRLKVGFMEAGCSWVPFWLDKMDEEHEKRPAELPWLKSRPSEYIRNCQTYFGVEPDEKWIPLVADELGAEKLLYASDYPHWDSEWPHTVSTLAGRDDVSDALRQKVMCDNALNFYGLRAPVPA
jgi:predicted TIM-barrel fold metal-dependent hydrolase